MLPAITMETEASHMLEAALEQMDDIIAGSKAAAVEFSNSMYDLGSPVSAGPLQVVQLAEDLKLALELQPNQEERDSLRAQLPPETAQILTDWLQSGAPVDFVSQRSQTGSADGSEAEERNLAAELQNSYSLLPEVGMSL
ncbi:liprin-beta-2-like [Plectropomus leopardus]|uniref:liprin-beta-2-like n=1 Tax=Plectropomus leopardus TaxID=160734 RepID=UPI001C4AE5B6|nr:liprin-beta-2-like [Plectropomus leopardus]